LHQSLEIHHEFNSSTDAKDALDVTQLGLSQVLWNFMAIMDISFNKIYMKIFIDFLEDS
jgi:hypothetical protein